MTEHERERQTDERLRIYAMRMRQHHAVPLFCLGVGQGDQAGQAVSCIPDGVPLSVIVGLMEQTLQLLKAQLGR